MKKLFVTVLFALLITSLLIACGTKSNNASTGNLNPTVKTTPHTSTGEKDISETYYKQLCSELWMDTNSLHICRLNDDGTYCWLQSKKEPQQISAGSWQLTVDDQKYLSLYLKDDQSGETMVLREIELYDTSIYAVDDEGNGIVWLTTELPE